jgi:hypothetical protein
LRGAGGGGTDRLRRRGERRAHVWGERLRLAGAEGVVQYLIPGARSDP